MYYQGILLVILRDYLVDFLEIATLALRPPSQTLIHSASQLITAMVLI